VLYYKLDMKMGTTPYVVPGLAWGLHYSPACSGTIKHLKEI